ncbi:hypothetical protein M3Y94_00248200 [Aphelenchoides besseyi]|nr:hypothetical protein M3Y94_00248200 [Aphelenchoides besseyi]KAI6236279.1 hypothetical protein M3Y95_00140700 [Aphelenchoides besseyi]
MASTFRRDNGRGERRYDVKQRTIKKYSVYDEDVASRYEYDEDEATLPINQKTRTERSLEISNMRDRNTQSRGRMQRQIKMSGAGKRDLAFKICVRTGGKSEVDLVLQSILEVANEFLPFNISTDVYNNVTFYVHTQEEADVLKSLSRRIYHPAEPNEKYSIVVTKTPAPWEALDPKIKTAIRDVVVEKFNKVTNSLDLSAFQFNKIFAERDLKNLCSLSRNAVFIETIKIVSELCPSITGLSLKKNRLSTLDTVSALTFACPNIKELDLSDNYLEEVKELKKIRRWTIERLFLENNPMTGSFSDASSYTISVHDFLPRVSFLDGSVVNCDTLKINADDRRRAGILYPRIQENYCPDVDLKRQVENLMLQYYEVYDGKPADKSRQMLVNAYDEDAIFTHSIGNWPFFFRGAHRPGPKGDEDAYRTCLRSSHNLLHEDKWNTYREKIVYKGSMAIAVALSALPQTEHDKGSFQLEFITVRPQLLIFTVRGLLRDGNDVGKPDGTTKLFIRTFAVVPRDGGKMAIINDDLVLASISSERMQRYTENMKKTFEAPSDPQPASIASSLGGLGVNNNPGPSGLQAEMQRRLIIPEQPQSMAQPIIPQQTLPTSDQQSLGYDRNDPQVQSQMIEAFSRQSNMKPEWSRQCLEELNWNYEAAGEAFNSRRALIPPEAFLS